MVVVLDTGQACVVTAGETSMMETGSPDLVLLELSSRDLVLQDNDVVVLHDRTGLDGEIAGGKRSYGSWQGSDERENGRSHGDDGTERNHCGNGRLEWL